MNADPTPTLPGRPGDPLRGRHIVLGVTGSISCYKAIEVASRLVQAGAIVDIAMTEHAAQFVTPLTFRSLTAREPYLSMWQPYAGVGEAHVELARRADAMLIAPATASTLARLANGLADDQVSLTALATTAPLLV
ncbi:MAG: phosphopantothenate synthase, partial [Chloroflexi bacterium]